MVSMELRQRQATRALWDAILVEFERQGPPMTVRQVFYRMSATGNADKTEAGYRRVQRALTEMRRAGALPYNYLADNTRWVRRPSTYSGIAAMLEQSQKFYRRALWDTQPVHVEIWLEKDALAGVINGITSNYDVPLYVTRGYPSLSYLYEAAQALADIDKPVFVYHFGDFDASGKDAARAIREGLASFGAIIDFREVAVTEAQIKALNLQTRPAKRSDPRAAKWGNVAVELDAIPPATLRGMVSSVIERHIDQAELERLRTIEREERRSLGALIREFRTSTSKGQGQA